jgi:molybdopterin converting factor small subunit
MAPHVTVRFWAGAQRAAGHAEEPQSAATLAELRAVLSARPELARVCAAASYLVDGSRVSEGAALPEGAVVDVLPPFAGG